jgi:hypothetical protein
VSDAENPLLAAFLGLLPMAAPERQEAILRRALQQVLADPDDQPSRPLVARSPTISTVDSEDWAILKPRLRAELELREMSLADLAKDAGIPLATVQKVLSPKGLVPGRLIADRMQAWLDSRAESVAPPAAVSAAGPPPSRTVGNGHAPASGIGAHALAGRLTVEQAAKLSGYTSLMSDRRVRETLGLTPSLLAQALARKPVPGEVVARLVDALADPSRLIAE